MTQFQIHHRAPERVLLPTVLSWNAVLKSLTSADVRALGTAAANSYHTENLLTKLTKLYSVLTNYGHVLQPLRSDRPTIPYSLRERSSWNPVATR